MKTHDAQPIRRSSTVILQAALVVIGLAALAALLLGPRIEGRNIGRTNVEIYFTDPFLLLVYIGSVPFFVALYKAFGILNRIRENKVFTSEVVNSLRVIKYCGLAILGFVTVAELLIIFTSGNDDRAGGVMMGVLVAFCAAVIATAAALLERILQNAIDIKNENDLTV